MDKGISHVLSMSILLYGLRRPIFNSQDKEPYSFVELKAQEKTGLLLMPTAKVTKNVSAAEGGGNVLCSILISIKTKAWLYSFLPTFLNEINGNQNRFLAVSFSIFGASQKYEYDLDVMALFFQEKRTNTQQLVPLPEVKVRASPVKTPVITVQTPVCTVISAQSIGNKSIAENSKENESII